MAKTKNTNKPEASSFLELNDALSKISPDGAIMDDCVYAKIDEWIPTGFYILNAAISGSLFGGMPNRRSLLFAGLEGTGKTFFGISILRNAQSMGYFPIIYDSEGSMDENFAKRLGIDTKKIRLENVGTIEDFATKAAKLNEIVSKMRESGKTPPKVIVFLDSLSNLSSLKEVEDTVDGNNKRDMTKQQSIRRMFRVIGNEFAKNGIPFIISSHVYAAIGAYVPTNEISGGGGAKYNASIIFMLTKSKLTDKESEEYVKKADIETNRVGIVVTANPVKQRFARPIKIQVHIPFYKKPNPYVGLEKYVSWKNCGIIRGKLITEKEYDKMNDADKAKCHKFEISKEGLKPNDNGIRYAYEKDTARTLVCKHLESEIPLSELYTDKVFTLDILHQLDDNIIKKTFMLPSIESLEDLAEISGDLLDGAEMGDVELGDENSEISNTLEEFYT